MSEEYTATQFAASMKVQCYDLIPEKFSEEDKDYIANILYDFTEKAFDALDKDDEYEFSYDKKIFISQIIAEWTYHKAVDLIKSKIPKEYWDASLQKLAFTVFEIAKQGIKRELPGDELLQVIEYHIVKTWKEIIEELYLKGAFNLDTKIKALKQSNIDDLAQEAKEKQENETDTDTNDSTDAEQIEKIKNNRGCMNVMQFLVYISATIITCLFVFLLKKFQIDTTILRQIKHLSFYIGIPTCFVFVTCDLIQHFKNSFSLKTFGIINEICKNVMFYSGCALFSVMCITGFKPLSCIIAAIICIKCSAIATVNQIKCKRD